MNEKYNCMDAFRITICWNRHLIFTLAEINNKDLQDRVSKRQKVR